MNGASNGSGGRTMGPNGDRMTKFGALARAASYLHVASEAIGCAQNELRNSGSRNANTMIAHLDVLKGTVVAASNGFDQACAAAVEEVDHPRVVT